VSVAEVIENKVKTALSPVYFELINESNMHAGPATESHFKLIAVCDDFDGLSLVKLHQKIYKILQDELAGSVHALALHLYSLEEWSKEETLVPNSPNCAGTNI
jgi:BolA family transcriptional regulator, general stress-responsive regulator